MDPVIGEVGSKTPQTAEDDLKFLRDGSEEDPTPEPEAEEEETEEEEPSDESEEETEDEEEKEEDDEEEEEEPEEVGLVTAKDLKAKYPDIFKKVPELKGIIYRERQYSEIFANPEEAQQANTQAGVFRNIESDLLGGNSENLLKAVKDDRNADFPKLAASLLPALKKLDDALFLKVISVPLKQVLRSAMAAGTKSGDKNLALSSQHIHNFIFGDTELDGKTELEQEPEKESPEKTEYRKKLEELNARDFMSAKSTVDNDIINNVREAFFDKFDPDNTLSKWTKDRMFESAVKDLDGQLTKDPRHMKNVEVLWRAAKAANYNTESKSRIVNAVLARAKQIIPQVRQKLRNEALAKDKAATPIKKKFKVVPSGVKQKSKPNTKDTSQMSDLELIRS